MKNHPSPGGDDTIDRIMFADDTLIHVDDTEPSGDFTKTILAN